MEEYLWKDAIECSEVLGKLAVTALVDEAELTPKPALVDKYNSGAHTDLNIQIMVCSARSLRETFVEIGRSAFLQKPSEIIRGKIASIGQKGEAQGGFPHVINIGLPALDKARNLALRTLDEKLIVLNASPGGSVDLLAATLFLDSLNNTNYKFS